MSLFHASTCFEHHVLIVRRPKLYYTASGIIKPIDYTASGIIKPIDYTASGIIKPIGLMIPEAV